MNTGRVIDGQNRTTGFISAQMEKTSHSESGQYPFEKGRSNSRALLFFEDVKHLRGQGSSRESTSEVLQQTSAAWIDPHGTLLLLDASTGPLTAKQEDLLAAARDDLSVWRL